MSLNWKYFTLGEFTKSRTAEKLGFSNNPLQSDINNMDKLVKNILDPLRKDWGSPIIITSGYRVPRLNEAVGGVKNSHHLYGKAADIIPGNNKFDDFVEFIEKWLKNKNYCQCIIERKGNSRWIHISYDENNNKKQFLK